MPYQPSPEEVVAYMDSLRNWGRWGDADTLGTLNLITPAARTRAAALVRDGESVSVARLIPRVGLGVMAGQKGPQSYMVQSGERFAWDPETKDQFQFALESLSFLVHDDTFTHIDDLSHVFYQGKMYNGRPASLVTSADGAQEQNVEGMRDGIFTRGILLDFARLRGTDFVGAHQPVYPEDIEAMEQAQGVRVEEGDAVLLRTGREGHLDRLEPGQAAPEGHSGWAAACLPWFRERGVALIGADVFNEANPTGYDPSPHPGVLLAPIHAVALVAMGLPLLDHAHLERLADVCAAKSRWEFCFTLNPLRLDRTTGSPVNPVAVF